MSAFCGVVDLGDRLDLNEVMTSMLDHLVLWNPDDQGMWRRDNVALGQLTLHNTPESKYESLPGASPSGGVVLVCSARLDNREELGQTLGIERAELSKTPDATLILCAYEKWDEDCPQYLLGDFAFALWDDVKKQLFCARDHMGQRLLYYHYKPAHFFSFATTVGGLLAFRKVPREVNEQKLADHLVLMCPEPDATFYKHVFRLPPAHTLKISERGLQISRYWKFSPQEIKHQSDQEYIDQFNDIFAEAIRCRLRSAFPVGAHLSGGLDSSSVAGVAARLLQKSGQTLNAFGAVPPLGLQYQNRIGWNNDDRHYMQMVANHASNIELHLISDEDKNPFSDLDRLYQFSDVPFLNPCNRTWVETILEQAAQKKVRTMLLGAMGNATISWSGVDEPHLVKKMVRRLRKSFRSVAGWTKERMFNEKPWSGFSSIHPRWAQEINLADRFDQFSWHGHDTRRWMIFDGIVHDALSAFAAQYAVYGVEYRDPTHDKRVVEYCLSLPNQQFYSRPKSRLLIRRAMAQILPHDVCWRVDRGAQGADWFWRMSQVRQQIQERVDDLRRSPQLHRMFDVDGMHKTLENWPDDELVSFELEKKYRQWLLRGTFVATFAMWIESRKENPDVICYS